MPTGNQADDVAAIVTAVSARMDLASAATFVGALAIFLAVFLAGVVTLRHSPEVREIFSDPGGRLSFKRTGGGVVIFSVLSVWGYCCVASGTFIPLDFGSMATLVGSLGAAAYGRSNEADPMNCPPPPESQEGGEK